MLSKPSSFRAIAVVACATIGVAVSVIPISFISLGVFLKPLAEAFDWGRGEIMLALTMASLTMAVAMPFAGKLIDQYGARGPAMGSLCGVAAGMLLLPTIIASFGLTGFYLCFCWFGIAGAPSSQVVYVKLISGRFDRNRGLALGFTMGGIAVGGGIVPALAALAINTEGWAAGFYLLGILPLLVGIPMVFLLETPALNIHAGRSDGTAALSDRPLYAEGMSFRDALRSRVFYTLLVIFLLTPMAMHALQLHLVSLLSDRGVSTAFSVGALSFLFSVSLVSGLVLGFIFDRFFAPKIGALCLFLTSLGVLLLLFVHDSSPALTMLAVGLLGLGAGTEGDLIALLISRYFGMRSYGVIYGAVFAALMLGSAVGPFLLGWIFDDFKSYDVALYGCAAAPALCALLLLTLPRYVFAEPEEQTPPAAVVPAV